jgi:hypothetical protein
MQGSADATSAPAIRGLDEGPHPCSAPWADRRAVIRWARSARARHAGAFCRGRGKSGDAEIRQDYAAKYEEDSSLFGFSVFRLDVGVARSKDRRQGRGSRCLHRWVLKTDLPDRHSASGAPRQLRQPDLRRLHPQGRRAPRRQVLERADQILSQHVAVLYDPETYLKQPAYSRSFRSIKRLKACGDLGGSPDVVLPR